MITIVWIFLTSKLILDRYDGYPYDTKGIQNVLVSMAYIVLCFYIISSYVK